jgi:hypothetical protein
MTSEVTFKSRHGYHNCDYQTWLKLRHLRKCLFQAIRAKAAWERWYGKEPQNRVRRHKIRDDQGRVIGYGPNPEPIPEPKVEPPFLQKNRIPVLGEPKVTVELLHKRLIEVVASTSPHYTPETVPPLGMKPEQIDALYDAVTRKE